MKLRFRPIIKGDWRTYFPGDEDLVAKASKDTGWAIEDELVVKKWLGYEFFGEDYKTSPENLSCLAPKPLPRILMICLVMVFA